MSSPGDLMRSHSLDGASALCTCRGEGGRRLQLLRVGPLGEVAREEVEEGLHLGVEGLGDGAVSRGRATRVGGRRTFFVVGSLTVLTRLLISLRMALAATPVVAVLKSIWLWPRRRAESLRGMRESMATGLLAGMVSTTRRAAGGGAHLRWLMWTGLVVEVEMSCGADWVLVRGGLGRW